MSDGTVGLVHRRRRISREEAKRLVGEYEASGLTRQAFCAGRGLSVAALDKCIRPANYTVDGWANGMREVFRIALWLPMHLA